MAIYVVRYPSVRFLELILLTEQRRTNFKMSNEYVCIIRYSVG